MSSTTPNAVREYLPFALSTRSAATSFDINGICSVLSIPAVQPNFSLLSLNLSHPPQGATNNIRTLISFLKFTSWYVGISALISG
ncbi:MAG TPA: hypothetical protein VFZ60_02620 [Nitrososphaeraceae archaeon]